MQCVNQQGERKLTYIKAKNVIYTNLIYLGFFKSRETDFT